MDLTYRRLAAILTGCLCAFISPPQLHADDLQVYRQARLAPDDPSKVKLFGADVQVAGRTAVVAGVDISLDYPVLYVFRFEGGGWVQQARLELPELEVNVSRSGSILRGTNFEASASRIVVGSPQWEDSECLDGRIEGRVFVFERDGSRWSGPDEIGLDDGCYAFASFGSHVDMSGDRIAAAGVVYATLNGNTGYARTFVKTDAGWQLERRFGCSTEILEDGCAHDVDLDGDVLLIGAAGDLFETPGDYSGRVFVHERKNDGWHTTTLFSEGAAANPPEPCGFGGIEDNFGDDLAVSGGTLAILDPQSCDDNGNGSYDNNPIQTITYEKTDDAWLPAATIPEVIPWELVRDRMWVWDRELAGQAVYTRNGPAWSRSLVLDNLGPFASEDRFLRYDFDGSSIIAGDPYNDISGNNIGSAVIYSLSRFDDVPYDSWAHDHIETLAAAGISSGCGNGVFCPGDPVTRAQMAVFIERGINGGGYAPPAATGNVFADVAAADFAAAFIEQLWADGITAGCGGGNYCPKDLVTRAQMAVFLLRAKYGAEYVPPPVSEPCFADVGDTWLSPDWMCQLAAEGITAGCGDGNYCPDAPVTRAQMAVFVVRTFGL